MDIVFSETYFYNILMKFGFKKDLLQKDISINIEKEKKRKKKKLYKLDSKD